MLAVKFDVRTKKKSRKSPFYPAINSRKLFGFEDIYFDYLSRTESLTILAKNVEDY